MTDREPNTATWPTCLTFGISKNPRRAGHLQDQVQITYASQLYQAGVDIIAVQELLGHSWISTTMRYVHVHATRVEDAVMAGQERAAARWGGLLG